jgi:uncharacterized protein YjdB
MGLDGKKVSIEGENGEGYENRSQAKVWYSGLLVDTSMRQSRGYDP